MTGLDLRPVGSLGTSHGPSGPISGVGRRKASTKAGGSDCTRCVVTVVVDPRILEFRQNAQDQQAQHQATSKARPERKIESGPVTVACRLGLGLARVSLVDRERRRNNWGADGVMSEVECNWS